MARTDLLAVGPRARLRREHSQGTIRTVWRRLTGIGTPSATSSARAAVLAGMTRLLIIGDSCVPQYQRLDLFLRPITDGYLQGRRCGVGIGDHRILKTAEQEIELRKRVV